MSNPNPQRAQCSHVGAQGGATVTRKVSDGYEIESPLYLLGQEVGTIVGRGKTEKDAADDLHRKLCEASDSLWA